MCTLRAVTIGEASVGSYGSQSVTELDSHANMAVAGQDCTIIAKSGHYATVTPFSADLPVMERVELVTWQLHTTIRTCWRRICL